jgi:hypothetical protein
MKKTLEESKQRIFEIMSQTDESFILPELQQSATMLMKTLRGHVNNLNDIIKPHFNKINGKLALVGKVNDIHFYVTLSNERGEIEGIHINDDKTNVSGFIKARIFEPTYDDVIDAIKELVYTEG